MKTDLDSHEVNILLDFHIGSKTFGDQIPMRFRIRQQDMFGENDDNSDTPFCWLRLFAPRFAAWGMACLRLLPRRQRAALDLDDYGQEILFKLDGDLVAVCSTILGVTARVKYQTLFVAWADFGQRVYKEAIQQPNGSSFFGWWQLLNEDPPPLLEEELTRESYFSERKECIWEERSGDKL